MVLLLLSATLLANQQDTLVPRFEEAVARALAVSPVVAAAEGAISAPRGERAETWWPFPENPTIEFERVRRRLVGARGPSSYDYAWSVSQEIEIAGQGFLRASAAGKRIDAAVLRAEDARRFVSFAARSAYLRLALAERRVELIDSNAVFAQRLADFAEKQLEAGEISRLEYNAATLEAARTHSEAQRAASDRAALAADLARLLWLPPDSAVRTATLPPVPAFKVVGEDAILALARAQRPDLGAATLAAEAAAKDLTVARLALVPNLELSGFLGREEVTDDLLGFSVGLKVPLFRWGQAARGAAAAERSIAVAELESTDRFVVAQVQTAVERYRRARVAQQRFATDVLRAATENVSLTEQAMVEGEASVAEVIVLRTAAVMAQLEYLDVLADVYSAWFELAAAVSASPTELVELLR